MPNKNDEAPLINSHVNSISSGDNNSSSSTLLLSQTPSPEFVDTLTKLNSFNESKHQFHHIHPFRESLLKPNRSLSVPNIAPLKMYNLNSTDACFLTTDAIKSKLQLADELRGLDKKEISRRLQMHGYNEFEVQEEVPIWKKYLQ